MDKKAFIERLQEIGTCEDDVTRRTLLSNLQTDCEADYDQINDLTETNAKLTNDNETLRKANLDLFLKVGKSKIEGVPEDKPEDKPKRRSFADLFDEKGGIK